MKIRSGFVSNSSSSSFVVMFEEDKFEQMKKEMTDFERAVVNKIGFKKAKAFGKNLMIADWITGNYNTFEGEDFTDLRDALKKDQKYKKTDDDEVYDIACDMWGDMLYSFDKLTEKYDGFIHTGSC